MAVEVKMPQLGESVFEGTIGRWLKAEGETVDKYEPLLEVITDKVDTEITAVDGGTVLKILVPEGETVKVGTVLALIGEAGEAVPEVIAPAPAEADGVATSAADDAPVPPGAPEPPPSERAVGRFEEEGGGVVEESAAGGRASPVAARMAADLGVDLAGVRGTGPGGQIRRQDVERAAAANTAADTPSAVAAGTAASAPSAAAVPSPSRDLGFISPRVARQAAEYGVDLRRVTGTGREGRITATDVEMFVAAGGAVEAGGAAAAALPPAAAASTRAASGVRAGDLVKLSPIRAAIADHMVRSVKTSPHVTTVHEADMSAVLAAYAGLKESYSSQGVRLTLTAFIIKAVADTLAEHPLVNSTWTDAGIQTLTEINIGMAVAAPQGLIVPVIRNADNKSLKGIARDVNDFAERARTKQLKPDDVQGGTFTLTNYGTLGSLIGTPIINQPQAAILGTGAIKKQPVVLEGPGGDSIGIRPLMFLCLTFDHRMLDGGTADPFMQDLVRRLESVTP